jgi:uncharacterized membrane protein
VVVTVEHRNNDLSTAIWERLDPGRTRNPLAVMKYRRDDGWNDAPPVRKPGDTMTLAAMAVGAVAGALAGVYWGFFAMFLGLIAGGVIGAVIGPMIIHRCKHSRQRRDRT